jgi:hypothetical protein
LRNQDVILSSAKKKGFGSSALWAHGRIFAMLSHGRLVVKLPRSRVDALVLGGIGERFDPRHDGRHMKEWLSVAPTSQDAWLPWAQEALTFAGSRQ